MGSAWLDLAQRMAAPGAVPVSAADAGWREAAAAERISTTSWSCQVRVLGFAWVMGHLSRSLGKTGVRQAYRLSYIRATNGSPRRQYEVARGSPRAHARRCSSVLRRPRVDRAATAESRQGACTHPTQDCEEGPGRGQSWPRLPRQP